MGAYTKQISRFEWNCIVTRTMSLWFPFSFDLLCTNFTSRSPLPPPPIFTFNQRIRESDPNELISYQLMHQETHPPPPPSNQVTFWKTLKTLQASHFSQYQHQIPWREHEHDHRMQKKKKKKSKQRATLISHLHASHPFAQPLTFCVLCLWLWGS